MSNVSNRQSFLKAMILIAMFFCPQAQASYPDRPVLDDGGPQPNHKKDVVQSVRMLRDECRKDSQLSRLSGTRMADWRLRAAQREAGEVRREAEEEIGRYPSRRYSAAWKEWREEITRDAMIREHNILENARMEAARHMKLATERQANIEASVEGLESQMSESAYRPGVHLNALGTNLYVRNYSSWDRPEVELVATQGRLISPGNVSRSQQVMASVHGKLLHP